MGTLVGHVGPGAGFLLIGLWQLFSHTRLFLLRPGSYTAPVWFPVRGVRHLELILIIVGTVTSINQRLPGCRGTFSEDSVCIAQQGTGGSGLLLLLPPTFPSSFLVRVRTLLQDYTIPSLIAKATLFTSPKQRLCS